MGQRMVQLENTFTAGDNGAVLHVSQLPPNPAILAPGPALLFVTVNGVPSVGVMVMVGNGELGAQPTPEATTLPKSNLAPTTGGNGGNGSGSNSGNGASAIFTEGLVWRMVTAVGVLVAGLMA